MVVSQTSPSDPNAMPRPIRTRFSPARLAVSALATVASLELSEPPTAQAPVGHLILSTYKAAGNGGVPGVGGIHFVEPTIGAVSSVTGLPCEISGTCANAVNVEGCDVVVHLPQTGQIVATAWSAIGLPVSLFLLDIGGTAVVRSQRYNLGTVTNLNGLANPAGALLGDGRVLLVMDPTNVGAPGGLVGTLLGIFDPTRTPNDPAALTPVPTSGAPAGIPNGLVVDQARGVAYIAMLPQLGTGTATIYEVDVPGGGALRRVAAVPIGVNAMALEPDGRLLVGGGVTNSSRLARIDPATGAITQYPQIFGNQGINALRVDPVTGDLFVAERDANLSRLSPREPTGTLLLVGNGGPGGWGRPSGLDMHDELRSYGVASGAGSIVRWQLGPNPGGSSTLGNANFTLTCDSGTAGQPAFWVFGATAIQQQIPLATPIELLAQPLILLATQVQAPPLGNRINLPLPTTPSLRGTQLFVQCLVPRGADLAASPGLEVTLR